MSMKISVQSTTDIEFNGMNVIESDEAWLQWLDESDHFDFEEKSEGENSTDDSKDEEKTKSE